MGINKGAGEARRKTTSGDETKYTSNGFQSSTLSVAMPVYGAIAFGGPVCWPAAKLLRALAG